MRNRPDPQTLATRLEALRALYVPEQVADVQPAPRAPVDMGPEALQQRLEHLRQLYRLTCWARPRQP